MPIGHEDEGFLARWSRRKAGGREPAPPSVPPAAATPPEPRATPNPVATVASEPGNASATLPLPADPSDVDEARHPREIPHPTLEDVAALTHAADYSRFVAPGVDSSVRNAAMRKLFSDPHFNVMDGLDTYIDDYGKPDPIAPALVRRMNGARALGLFADEDAARSAAAEQEARARGAFDGPRRSAHPAPPEPGQTPPSAAPQPTFADAGLPADAPRPSATATAAEASGAPATAGCSRVS